MALEDMDLIAARKRQAIQSGQIADQNQVNPGPQTMQQNPYQNTGAYQQISQGYKDYLGRDPSYSEVMSHLGNGQYMTPQSVNYALNNIRGSQEAHDYQTKQNQPPAAPTPPQSPSTATGGVPPPAPAAANGGPVPTTAGNWQSYINTFQQGMPTPPSIKLPGTDLPTYQGAQLMSPEGQQAQGSQMGLLQKVLQSPDIYSDQNVQQMQEANKEQALALQHGNQQQLADRYAAMGRAGSGRQDADIRRMGDNTMQQILGGNRDINLQAATANNQARLGALSGASGVLNDLVGRNQAQAGENYKGYQSNVDKTNFALQRALGQAGLDNQNFGQNMQTHQLALQSALGAGGLSLDQYKTDLGNQLGWYSAMSNNNNFMQNLMANLSMFNTNQRNNQYNGLTN